MSFGIINIIKLASYSKYIMNNKIRNIMKTGSTNLWGKCNHWTCLLHTLQKFASSSLNRVYQLEYVQRKYTEENEHNSTKIVFGQVDAEPY